MHIDLVDLAASMALLVLVAVFGLGSGRAISRLWVLMRYEVVLLWALPAAYRIAASLHANDTGDVLQRAQAVLLVICATRALLSVRQALSARWPQ